MLDAIEPFLFNGGDQMAVANNRGRRIAVICIDAQNVHCQNLFLLKSRH